MALEKELATYEKNLPSLLDQAGKFVLIKEDQVVDVFDSYADAAKAAYTKFGLESFLIKRISQYEEIQYITRHVTPCPA